MAYEKYLVTLIGGGDVSLMLVDEDIWNWINMEQDFPLGRFLTSTETVESLGFDSLSELNPTEGSSPDNDRALMASQFVDDDEQFDSVMSLWHSFSTAGLNILGEYEGVIY